MLLTGNSKAQVYMWISQDAVDTYPYAHEGVELRRASGITRQVLHHADQVLQQKLLLGQEVDADCVTGSCRQLGCSR